MWFRQALDGLDLDDQMLQRADALLKLAVPHVRDALAGEINRWREEVRKEWLK